MLFLHWNTTEYWKGVLLGSEHSTAFYWKTNSDSLSCPMPVSLECAKKGLAGQCALNCPYSMSNQPERGRRRSAAWPMHCAFTSLSQLSPQLYWELESRWLDPFPKDTVALEEFTTTPSSSGEKGEALYSYEPQISTMDFSTPIQRTEKHNTGKCVSILLQKPIQKIRKKWALHQPCLRIKAEPAEVQENQVSISPSEEHNNSLKCQKIHNIRMVLAFLSLCR